MKHIKMFEEFTQKVNEAVRLRGKKDWEDIAYELDFDGNEFVDDLDKSACGMDGSYKVEYDGDTGFDVTVMDKRGKEVGTDGFDADGYGSSEIRQEIQDAIIRICR